MFSFKLKDFFPINSDRRFLGKICATMAGVQVEVELFSLHTRMVLRSERHFDLAIMTREVRL